MQSMTGFGSAVVRTSDFECKVEIKSVNHRYLNIVVKGPNDFFSLEEKIRQQISEYINRGRLEVRVDAKFFYENQVEPVFNPNIVNKYYEGMKKIQELTGEEEASLLPVLAKMPEVFSLEKKEFDAGKYWPAIEEATYKAILELIEMKKYEGQSMKNDIEKRKYLLIDMVGKIKDRSPIMHEHIKERFVTKLEELSREGKLDRDRIHGEAALFGEKSVIDEEIVRLESHLEQLDKMLGEENVGRKLDFLLQEINREINTIASKATDEEISNKVIEVKSQVEKVREQVQNVE